QYKEVPGHIKVDNVIPSVFEIPSMLSAIRHPRRNRAVSVGPQSAADAYETLAFRQKRRRESTSGVVSSPVVTRKGKHERGSSDYFGIIEPQGKSNGLLAPRSLPTPASSSTSLYESMQDSSVRVNGPLTPDSMNEQNETVRSASQDQRENEKEDREIFSQLEKPRVRYDVEA
ncbi:MAG: hypothetical protein Q9187_007151, partial [Circinaria calcarea]